MWFEGRTNQPFAARSSTLEIARTRKILLSPAMRKLQWGILSTGRIATQFANGLAQSQTGELAAVASRTLDAAKAFAEAHASLPRPFGSYDELLAHPAIEAVYVATPHPMHREWAVAAANAGKHVLCEKPIGMNAHEAAAMIEAARSNGVFLMEAFMYRCHPQTERVLGLIRSGALGTIELVQASFGFQAAYDQKGRLFNPELGGGGILDIGCYPVSFARLIAGTAAEPRPNAPAQNPDRLSATAQLGQTGVDELATATLEFESGLVAQLSCSIRQFHDNRARVFGSEGWIDIPWPWAPAKFGGTSTIHLHRPVRGEPDTVEDLTLETAESLYQIEADHVANHVSQQQSPAMPWDDTLGNMQTLDRWREAIGLRFPADDSAPATR